MRAAKVMPYWSRRECGVIRKATPETKQAQVCWAMGFEGELPVSVDMLPGCSLGPGGSLHHCQASWYGSHLERAGGTMCERCILVLIDISLRLELLDGTFCLVLVLLSCNSTS